MKIQNHQGQLSSSFSLFRGNWPFVCIHFLAFLLMWMDLYLFIGNWNITKNY